MAQLAGMRLVHRWAGLDHEPFTDRSPTHVSVWRLEGRTFTERPCRFVWQHGDMQESPGERRQPTIAVDEHESLAQRLGTTGP